MKKLSYCILLALVAVACGPLGKYKEQPTIAENDKLYGEGVTTSADSANIAAISWKEFFTDPLLRELIDSSLAGNYDIADAYQNIRAAEYMVKSSKMAWIPFLNLDPKINGNYSNSGAPSYDYNILGKASWEVDIFGRHATNTRSAKASLEQAKDYKQAVQTSLISAVANTYFTLLMLDQEMVTAKEMEAIWKDMVQTIRILKREGFADQVAVNQYESTYVGILIKISSLEKSIRLNETVMSLLLGKSSMKIKRGQLMEQNFTSNLAVGVPLQMLQYRPDVRSAQRDVEVAFYTTKSAWLNFFPTLTIGGTGSLLNVFGAATPISAIAQVTTDLLIPVLNAGNNYRTLKIAQVQQERAKIALEKSLLTAASEVNDAIAEYKAAEEQKEYYAVQVVCLQEAFSQTKMLVENSEGKTYLDVLTAHNALIEAKFSCITNIAKKLQATVDLYSALGGGSI